MDDLPANAICYLSSARGIYIPQNFFEITKPECIDWCEIGLSTKDWILNSCSSPEEEDYREAWSHAEQYIIVVNPKTGVRCRLLHDKDLWLIPLDPTEMAEVNFNH